MEPSHRKSSAEPELRRLREVRIGPLDVTVERRSDGTIYIENKHPLGSFAEQITDRLIYWATLVPERSFLAERGPDGAWRRLSYRETLQSVRALGAALLE